jgi:histidyl-tRNA synthetase
VELKAVRGMNDLFGPEMDRWLVVESKARQIFKNFGYGELRTPVLEKLEVFSQTVGDDTDIVEKQMYLVAGDDSEKLALRPEGTAAFMRAVVEHQLHQTGRPQRFYYYLSMFRHERPQKGRLRQFHQFGAEFINDDSPEADAELITLLDAFLKSFDISEYEVRINTVGCNNCRPAYKELLKAYLKPHFDSLCANCQKRFERSPMRVLDCKKEGCQKIALGAPRMVEHLCADCTSHHTNLKKRLTAADVKFIEDTSIVRGLDYYIRTAFEFTSSLLGAQSAIAGGGRYDGLSSRFSNTNFPGVGFGLGMERLMLILEQKQSVVAAPATPKFYFAPLGLDAFDLMFPLSLKLKRRGVAVEMTYGQKKLKDLLKLSDRSGAKFTLMIGDREIQEGQAALKDMANRTQENIAIGQLEEELYRRGSESCV